MPTGAMLSIDEHLETARWHVARGIVLVDEQIERVRALREHGFDTSQSEMLLQTMTATLIEWRRDLRHREIEAGG